MSYALRCACIVAACVGGVSRPAMAQDLDTPQALLDAFADWTTIAAARSRIFR